jgi:cytoskeletal protein RodZ
MSLGKDLAAIRNKLGFSLEEIQSQIKIPMDVLKSIENDSIFSELESNKTYTRSFVRSYAKALGMADDLIVSALDSLEAGLYEHGTILDEELAKKHAPIINPDVLDEPVESSEPVLNKPDIEEVPREPTPTLENVNWADMGKKFSAPATNPKVIFPVVIALGLIGLAVVIYIFREPIFGMFSSSEPEQITETTDTPDQQIITDITADSSQVEDLQNEQSLIEDNVQDQDQSETSVSTALSFSSILSDTLTITVYASYDKLEPVRVTSDFNWRTNPFWMEQGEAYNFNFIDTVLVRGQYSRMILLFNGHTIDNPFVDYYDDTFDSILLTREGLNTTYFLSPPPSEFPYDIGAPDSLVFPLQN